MKKAELVGKYVNLKLKLWELVDGKKHDDWKKRELFDNTMRNCRKADVEYRIQLLEESIEKRDAEC